MKRAQARDAVLTQKLHFRSKLANCDTPPEANHGNTTKAPSLETTEMTINEIINGIHWIFKLLINLYLGDGKEFPGLIPLIRQFLDGADVDVDTRCTITQYLNFIQVSENSKLVVHLSNLNV